MGKKHLALLAAGAVLGVAALLLFEGVMDYTNRDGFCLGCHNHNIPAAEYRNSSHYKNNSGVTASCADCHVPKTFGAKLIRKTQAIKELYGHLTGVIDSDEKYLALRNQMADREIKRLVASDSATCRSCHNVQRMNSSTQSPLAQRFHKKQNLTCVQCHRDTGHPKTDPEVEQ